MSHPFEESRPISACLPPGSSKFNKTGSWRVLKPVINQEKCVKCGTCWLYCPEGAILRGQVFTINYDYCKGCGICAEECPAKVIAMVKEE
ncbi:MAG: 4Fe-4S binding protein [Candidatus Bathyarchaeia archaeon]